MTEERTSLEAIYFRVRSDWISAQNMLDEARVRAEEKEMLLQELRDSKPSELSDKLMAMSNTLQQRHLAVLKAERRSGEMEERERHAVSLLGNRTKEVQELEQQVAKLEKDMHVKEEKWRLADNDRQRLYFNQRLGGVESAGDRAAGPGSLGAGALKGGHIGGSKPSGSSAAHESLHGDQVAKLNQELARLQDELLHKDQVIRRLKSW